ncbi:hypothetical protein B0E38_05749 [Streptomyces sp. 111WW2]|nr:hypothetical protein B0E38_05749 [Streptomyces sp. 111WW2]
MEAALTVFALLFLLAVVLGVYATVKAVGAAKRSVDRGISQARRTVEDHTLRAKSLVQVGPAAELAQLRLTLRTSMRATQDALHARVAEDESLKESLALFERLSAHGFELDGELRRLESEPDRATLAERLPGRRPGLAERADRRGGRCPAALDGDEDAGGGGGRDRPGGGAARAAVLARGPARRRRVRPADLAGLPGAGAGGGEPRPPRHHPAGREPRVPVAEEGPPGEHDLTDPAEPVATL